MARENITKRIYCKQAVFLNQKERPTLQNKMSDALTKLRTVGKRKETHGDDARYVRAVIYHRAYANMLFGIFASYERGTHQLAVSDDDEAEMLTVDQVAPPRNQENKRQEFLEGVCYFALFKNHVVLVPSRALGPKPMEQYTNWLLEKAGVLGRDNRVGLSEHITQATREKIKTKHVKEVEIGAPLLNPETVETHEVKGQRTKAFEVGGLGVDILKQVLGNKVDNMRLEDAIDGNIEISLKIRYKRVTTEKAHKVLDNIALAVRNLDEDEVKLTLDGGGTIKGSELKLSAPISVEAHDGVPNPDELFEKMRDWLLQQIDNQIIEP